MYNKGWLYFIVVVLLLGALLQEGTLVIAGALASMALGSAWLWNRFVLRSVEYQRVFSQTRVFPGEKVDLNIRVTNRKLLPLPWLDIGDAFPTKLALTKGTLSVTAQPGVGLLSHLIALRWYERVTWQHQIEATARGYYAFGPLTLKSGDMFGMFTAQEERPQPSYLMVYPRVVPIERLGLPAKQPFGEMRSPQRIFEDPIRTVGIRDYQRGDSFKRIHWKATARRQALQVRVYDPTATLQVAIFLNVSTFEHYWEGIDSTNLEAAISAAASLAKYALDAGYAAGLFANAPTVQGDQAIRVRPGRSTQQFAVILETLAKLNPFALLTIEEMIESETPRLPWGATIVVVTAVVTPSLMAVLTRLRETGRQTVLLTFGDSASSVGQQGVLTYTVRGEDLMGDAKQ